MSNASLIFDSEMKAAAPGASPASGAAARPAPAHAAAAPRRPAWLRYGAAAAVTGIVLALKLLLASVVASDAPFLMFFVAVMAAAAFGGLGPGLLAVLLATLANNYYFLAPFGTFSATRESLFLLQLFIVEGVFISLICARMKKARMRAEESEADALELEKRILEISEAEQRRIGHDLHDGLGQHLTGISLISLRLHNHLNASASPNAAEAQKLSQLAKTAVEWTHDLCRTLSPPALESSGLAEALRELAANVQTLFNTECTLELNGGEPAIPLSSGVHLYRIVQEATSNAIRHGQARRVQIKLRSTPQQLTIDVVDDGKGLGNRQSAHVVSKSMQGFDTLRRQAPDRKHEPRQSSGDGMGLRIMRYRARMIGATISVGHDKAGGTIVTCRYPLATEQLAHGKHR